MDAFEKHLIAKETRAGYSDGSLGRFDRDWMARPAVKGKRVVLRGLPVRIPFRAVRDIVQGYVLGDLEPGTGTETGLLADEAGVVQLPT